MFNYNVLRSETKNPLTRHDFIIISEALSCDLPSLRSREGKGVSLYETKKCPIEKMCIKIRLAPGVIHIGPLRG
jgi:hypothetical protein